MNDKYLHSILQEFGTFSEILQDSSKSERYTLICKNKIEGNYSFYNIKGNYSFYTLLRFAVEVQVFHCVQIPLQFHCIFYRQTMQILNVKTAKTHLQWVVCKKCSKTTVKLQWDLYNSENL